MADTILVACVSAVGALLVSIVTQVVNVYIERFKGKVEIQQKELQIKRERLNEIYKELITIVNLYPNSSPSDILEHIEGSPNYFMEHFDSTLISLDYQIEDYKEQLKIEHLDYKQRNDITEQILNREYAKNEISKIRDEYYIAKDKYKLFCESSKVLFDLYAGQDVRNCLVEFEVVIHNIFISGRKAGDKGDPINNIIQVSKRNLVNSMRKDFGTY